MGALGGCLSLAQWEILNLLCLLCPGDPHWYSRDAGAASFSCSDLQLQLPGRGIRPAFRWPLSMRLPGRAGPRLGHPFLLALRHL